MFPPSDCLTPAPPCRSLQSAPLRSLLITVTAREALGKAVNRKFSVDKLGYEKAVKAAVAWRAQILKGRAAEEK